MSILSKIFFTVAAAVYFLPPHSSDDKWMALGFVLLAVWAWDLK